MNKILLAFRETPFLMLWLGEVFTQISVNLFNFLLILFVFSLTKSNTAVSGIVITFTLPAILFGSLAGAYVDRWNKKHVLFIANITRALLLLVLVFFHQNIYVIFIISFIFSIITQFFIPAETPMLPAVVPERLLYSANALFGVGLYGSILIAYILAGALLLSFERGVIIGILAALLLAGAGFIALIRIPQVKQVRVEGDEKKTVHIWEDFREMFALMKLRPVYQSLFLLAFSQILILIIATITPGYASQVLNMRVEDFPLAFMAPAALGVVVGAVCIASFFHEKHKEQIVNAGLVISGIAMLIMPFGSRIASRDSVQTVNNLVPTFLQISAFDILIVLAFILGLGNAMVFVPSNTILQEKTSAALRGKVYGILNSVVGLFSLLPIIIVGGLADIVGIGRVIIGIGFSIIFIAFVRIFIDIER